MLAVVDERTQTRQGPFLVLGLVAGLGAFYQNLLHLAGIGILPVVTQSHPGFHLVDVLPSGSARAESVPAYLALVYLHLEFLRLGQYGHGCGRSVDAALRLGGRHSLHAVHARLILHHAVHAGTRQGKHYFLIATGCAFGI